MNAVMQSSAQGSCASLDPNSLAAERAPSPHSSGRITDIPEGIPATGSVSPTSPWSLLNFSSVRARSSHFISRDSELRFAQRGREGADLSYSTILHVVPLYEVAAEVRLADLFHVPHADVQEVISEEPHGWAHALPFKQHTVCWERRRGDVIPHQSPKFLPKRREERLLRNVRDGGQI